MACSYKFLHMKPPVCGDRVWTQPNVYTNMMILFRGPSNGLWIVECPSLVVREGWFIKIFDTSF